MRSIPSFTVIGLGLLLALGAGLRLWGLGDWYVGGDEAMHLEFGLQESLGATLRYSSTDAHPPLLYVFTYFLQHTFGVSDFVWLRGVALVPGIGFILVAYFVGRRLQDPVAAWVMAAIAMTATVPVLQSQTVRSYGMLCFFSGLSLLGLARPGRIGRTLYVGGAVLALLSHMSAVFLVFGSGLAALANILKSSAASRRRELLSWLVVHLFLAAVFAAVAYRFLSADGPVSMPSQNYMAPHLPDGPLRAGRAIMHALALTLVEWGWAKWVVVLTFFGGLTLTLARKRHDLFLLGTAPLAFAGIAGLCGAYPLSAGRWTTFLVLPALLVLAYAVSEVESWLRPRAGWTLRIATVALLPLLVAMKGLAFQPDRLRATEGMHWPFRVEEYRAALMWERERLSRGDVVLARSEAESLRRRVESEHGDPRGFPPPPAETDWIRLDAWELSEDTLGGAVIAALDELQRPTLIATLVIDRAPLPGGTNRLEAAAAKLKDDPLIVVRTVTELGFLLLVEVDITATRARHERGASTAPVQR